MPGGVVGNIDLSAHGSRPCIKGHQACVQGADEDRVFEQRNAAIDLRETDVAHVLRQTSAPMPQPAPGARVDGRYGGRRLRDVHDAVDHER